MRGDTESRRGRLQTLEAVGAVGRGFGPGSGLDGAFVRRAARAGAQDCLSRGEVTPDLISRTIVHAIERHKILQQLTEAKQRQRFLATHDSLTELPNRYSFMQQLGPMLHAAKRRETKLAVLFFDLDGFRATLATGTLSFVNSRDSFAGTNLTAVVLEMPLSAATLAGSAPNLRIWAASARLPVPTAVAALHPQPRL